MAKSNPSNEEIFDALLKSNWPQFRDEQKWKKTSIAYKGLLRGVKILCSQGMDLESAVKFLAGTYWCAFDEFNRTPKPQPTKQHYQRSEPYFDEYDIAFQLNGKELTLEQLHKDYVFCMNIYVADGNVWWALNGKMSSGGPLHDFLNELRLSNYAFGPTKAHRGFTKAKLAEMNAVGVYKKKPH